MIAWSAHWTALLSLCDVLPVGGSAPFGWPGGGAYAGAAFAAWAGLGMLCLRTVAVRSRFGWQPLGAAGQGRLAAGGVLFCGLSLAFALSADQASFALVLWVTQLGVLGVGMALLLPWHANVLGASTKLAAGASALAAAALWFVR